ncbi:hypothetical protein [Paenarthrobacter ilicis]|uniref:YobI family P-loop NTPase n=1 Tax=Paenarthrobacter ilicis TaxID=43665 RepID=UPI0038671C54
MILTLRLAPLSWLSLSRRQSLHPEAAAGEIIYGDRLHSLSPAYDHKQHYHYVQILTSELTRSGPESPRNVALTGHYGSGKSSVLGRTEGVLAGRGVKVVNLSIPSLGIGDGRGAKESERPINKTNLIQKEIVKQLLYRRKPSDMPASRYNRLDTFHYGRAARRGIGLAVAAAGFALLARVPEKVRDALPSELWSLVDTTILSNGAVLIQWSSLLIVFALTWWAAMWLQKILQLRIRVTELTAGPTKVTLSDSSSSYFDEYLDEIVYFFQTSATEVVIFEDLDRFKDPHIFETLRELNMLLNNAEQTGRAPIRFVYAIRDSIFEQLDVEVGASGDGQQEDENGKEGSQPEDGENRRLMSTNRTKFFDTVVPMVPFISHKTSRDLIRKELEGLAEEQRPSRTAINTIGAHLTDMRLIKNIRNEYIVFRQQILTDHGLKELTVDRLFASIVYKNIYLADYEKIREGTSLLDEFYAAYREWAKQQTAEARDAERRARAALRQIDAIESRSVRLGKRLQRVLLARQSLDIKTGASVVVAQTQFAWKDLTTPQFWNEYLKDHGDLVVYYRVNYGGESIAFDKVQALMGESLVQSEWTAADEADVNRKIVDAAADHRFAQHASMTDALGQAHRLFSHGGVDRSISDVMEELFRGASLAQELLREGLIDENFTLYVTQFPGQAISASAMNFIIKAVQPDVMDMEYHFGSQEEVNNDDIKEVLDAESLRLLGGQSVYNIEIFDYLIMQDPDKLKDALRRLATNADSDTSFIKAYIESGKSGQVFVERLTGLWPGIFDFLIGDGTELEHEDLLDAALRGVRQELSYTITSEQRMSLTEVLPDLETVKTPQPSDRSVAIAETIRRMGIWIDELDRVAEPLRNQISKRNAYPVTFANLVTIMGDKDSLPLDILRSSRKSDVYSHVLAHLDDYLVELDQNEGIATVADSMNFLDVLLDVAKVDVDSLEQVASRASPDCMIDDLGEIDGSLWPALAEARRITLSARNVAAYMKEHDVDSDLARALRLSGAISVDADDPTPLLALAVGLLNAEGLRDAVKLQVVNSLGLEPESVPVGSLNKDALRILPKLVRDHIVLDDAAAYNALGTDDWATKAELIEVSAGFPTYMTQLALNKNDLYQMASRALPDAVKDVLLTNFEVFAPRLGPMGATALAKWAATNGRTPTADAIVTMAERGDASRAKPIVKLLGSQASRLELGFLISALSALGEPYSRLTRTGRDRPKVDAFDGMEAILARLKEANIVSKFEKNTKKRIFEVSKRYS